MVSPLPLSISVHTNQLDAVGEVCGPALGCAPSDVVGQLFLLVVSGLVAVFVLAAIQRVSEARTAVSEERSRTATEQQAFARFAREVARLDASRAARQLAPANGMVAAATGSNHSPPDRGLEAVRDAYRDSVMGMAHYEEEYAEPMARHMREEFGEEVATAVTNGGQLTPELKQVLVDRAREAADERERLMHRLDREAEALDAADEQFSSIAGDLDRAEGPSLRDRGFERLVDEWNRLGELESRLSRLLDQRQESLRSNELSAPGSGRQSLNDYLYGDLDTRFPILADGAVLADRVKGARSRVLTALTASA